MWDGWRIVWTKRVSERRKTDRFWKEVGGRHDGFCLAKMPTAPGHPSLPKRVPLEITPGKGRQRHGESSWITLARIAQGIRKLHACLRARVRVCVCVCVCVCIAMFLHPLIEEMLPFSSTTLRLSVYTHSLGQAQGTLEKCGPAAKSTARLEGQDLGGTRQRKRQTRGRGESCLPAWLVYYYSSGRRNVQTVLLWPKPCLLSFFSSFPFSSAFYSLNSLTAQDKF